MEKSKLNGSEKLAEEDLRTQVSEVTPAEGVGEIQYEAQNLKLMQRDQEFRNILANFFGKPSKIDQSASMHSSSNSEKTEHYQAAVIMTDKEPENDLNVCRQEPGEILTVSPIESEENVFAGCQESKDNVSMFRVGTKEGEKLECGVTTNVNEPKHLQSSKSYVTFPNRKSDDIPTRFQNLYAYVYDLPRVSDDELVRPRKTKDYVTLPRPRLDGTAHSTKTKDFVTLQPRKLDDELIHSRLLALTKGLTPFSRSKDYVTQPSMRKPIKTAPQQSPTHVRLCDLGLPLIKSSPKTSSPVSTPTRSLQKTIRAPECEKPPHGELGLQQRKKTRRHKTPRPKSQTIPPTLENNNLPLKPMEEVCPEVTVETNEPRVQRNRRILGALMPPLSTGVQNFVQRICERHVPTERQAFVKKFITGFMMFLYSLLVAGIVAAALYFAVTLAISYSGSIVASPLYDSHFNLDIPEPRIQHNHQVMSLDTKLINPVTRLGIGEMDSNVNLTTQVMDLDVNVTNPSVDLVTEIIPVINGMNYNVNVPEFSSKGNVVTLVTSITTIINDFDTNVITSVTDFNVTNPVTDAAVDFDTNFTNPVTDAVVDFVTNVTNPVTDAVVDFDTYVTNPMKDAVVDFVTNVTNPLTDADFTTCKTV